jgi:osmoprotectant transport system permease protein
VPADALAGQPPGAASAAGGVDGGTRVKSAGPPSWLHLLATPIGIAAVLGLLYAWVSSQPLDSIERHTLNAEFILDRTREHLVISLLATALVIVIAVPLGILVSRRELRWAAPVVLAAANLGQGIPTFGLLVILAVAFRPGFGVALIGLVAAAVLPVLRNTIVGIQQVDPALVEAARGMGMTGRQVLLTVELRLAVPAILGALRTALVLTVGIATIVSVINAGGLGSLIFTGVKLQRDPVLITGGVLAACLAFFVDWFGAVAERLLRPRGV